jgi:cytochrome P450
LPIVGQGIKQFSSPAGAFFLDLLESVPNDGIIYFRSIFNADRLFLTNPSSLSEVLVTKSYDFEKPVNVRLFLSRVLGNGLVVTEGELHKHQRKHAMPSFSFRSIKALYPTFWNKSVEFIRAIEAEIQTQHGNATNADKAAVSGVIDINTWAPKITLDMIGIAGLGHDLNTLKHSEDELVKCYDMILEPTLEARMLFTISVLGAPWMPKLLPWDIERRFQHATDSLRSCCGELVRAKRAMISTSSGGPDLLSGLIQSNNFSDEELIDQLLTFLAAG